MKITTKAEAAVLAAARKLVKAERTYEAMPTELSNAAWCKVEQLQEELFQAARALAGATEPSANQAPTWDQIHGGIWRATKVGDAFELWRDSEGRAHWPDQSRVTEDECARIPRCELLTELVRTLGLTVLGFASEEDAENGVESELRP